MINLIGDDITVYRNKKFKDNKYGQGQVLLKVKDLPKKVDKTLELSSGQQYLLGQGLYHFREGLLKAALSNKQSFKVILILDNQVNAQELIDTMMTFGLLGGLGSRARKGWGSISIRSLAYTAQDRTLTKHAIPEDKQSYKAAIKQILSTLADDLPPFTSFSTHTRIDLSLSDSNSGVNLLTKIGSEMQLYRSYGKNNGGGHKVNVQDAEQNFKDDHDLVLDFGHGKTVNSHPKRVVFGLPHNYFYSDKTKVDVNAESSRRASPLMIHIHQFPSGEAIAVQSLMKAEFLPKNQGIQLQKGRKVQTVKSDIDWGVISTYLERFKQGEQLL